MNKIYLGQVKTNYDETNTGKLTVNIPSYSEGLHTVVYTTPFYSMNNGGFLSIPEPGAEILVYHDDDLGKFYYLSTIVDLPTNLDKKGLVKWTPIADKYVYTARDKPQRQTFTDSFGNGMTISSRTMREFISSKVDLNSRAGKRITLSDSPLADMLMIRNEHGDGIVISSAPSDVHAERSIEVKSKGSHRNVSLQGEVSVMVIEGRDITLENFSTGSNSIRGQEGKKSGNINLRSHESDINIVTKGQEGKIFLNTPKARIQIEADGTIQILSDGDVNIKAEGDLNMVAQGDIRMDAGRALTMKATQKIIADTGVMDLHTRTTMNLFSDTAINLAPTAPVQWFGSTPLSPATNANFVGVFLPPGDLEIPDPEKTDYDE